MKVTINFLKLAPRRLGVYLKSLTFLGLLGFGAISTQAQAPYCDASHSQTCSGLRMYVGAVRISQGANVIFDKKDDGCNSTSSPNYALVSTNPSFTLNAGANYTMELSTGPTYQVHIGVWIDFNQDNDFLDAGEWVSKGWADLPGGGSMQSRSLNIGCSGVKGGTTRMRIRSEYFGYAAFTQNSACGAMTYGETEDWTIEVGLPKSLAAGFFMPDTAFVKTRINLVNSNQSGYIGHWWDVNDDNTIEYTTTNASHKFNTEGKYCIRLKSENCLGRDSVLKCVQVVKPLAVPLVDFISDKNVVELYDGFKLTDLSTNGPIFWDWYMYQPADSVNTMLTSTDLPQFQGTDDIYNKNPDVYTAKGIPGFPDIGKWTVCLTSSNDQGTGKTKCKQYYIEVTR